MTVLDRHTIHTKSAETIELARENGVLELSIPAHTPHRLQPLHITYFNQSCDK
jgi:hypothetical protein